MTQGNVRLIVGALIAAVFLGLYGYVLVQAILHARNSGWGAPTDEAYYILQVVGGLVSAVVVAELALTNQGQLPSGRALGLLAGPGSGTGDAAAMSGAKTVAIVYVLVWLALGVAALVFGMIDYATKVPQLIDFAKTWLGIAMAAAYAYFGIQPQ